MGWFSRAPVPAGIDERFATIEKLLQKHAEALAELDDKHVRLRGKVYAHKLHKPEGDDEKVLPTVDQMTRDELRRSLTQSGRFIPGRPVSHDK